MQAVSLALALAWGLTLALPPEAIAGSGEPLATMFKKKATANAGPAASTGHSTAAGGKATTVSRIVNDGSVVPFVAVDSPASLQALADRYAGIVAAGGWPKVPSGKMKKGSSNKAVAALNKRLHIEGYLRAEATVGEFAEVFTSASEDALRRFQANHGLAVTGTIDGPTLTQLNVPAERRLATIRANLPRIAEYAKDLGERYAIVNVPAAQIETVQNGRVFSIHNAIVGRPSRPTPVVMTPLATIRFNPYWNAPASIVEKDIVPRMLSTRPSKVMGDMNMKIFKGVGGPEIDPDDVNWRRAVVDDYHFRQEPGGGNAMATAKIEFNSPFGIYLHDTPEPHLFNSGARFYSSGCVRVEKVATFLDWVLQGQDGINSGRIAELADTKERLDTPIADPPQLRVTYLTAWPAKDGVAAFRNDIYELDRSGFVVGQPMPVGESGPRFVLKPIPRTPDAVDADEAFGFASLFGRSRNSDRAGQSSRPERAARSDDSLIGKKTPGKKTPGKTTASKSSFARATGGFNSGKEGAFGRQFGRAPASKAKKKVAKPLLGDKKSKAASKTAAKARPAVQTKSKTAAAKPDSRAKLAKADPKAADTAKTKKVKKTDDALAAAKKVEAAPDAKATAAKKPVTTAKKPAAECKAGADGKLPAGCKASAPAAAKKPVAKPAEKTASVAN